MINPDEFLAFLKERRSIRSYLNKPIPEKEIEMMKVFCEQRGLQLQKIMQFSLYDRGDLSRRFQAERPPKCSRCNRLRLTADGFLKACLFSDNEIRLDFGDIGGSILEAVAKKPENGSSCRNRLMSQIGG